MGWGGDKSIPIITLKLSQNLLFRKEHITKPYLLKLGNWKAVAFLNTLKEHSTLFDITWLTSIEIFFEHFCTISVQVLCDKVWGEGGVSQNMILYDTGVGRVWRRAKLYYIILERPLNNLETPMKQPWNIVEIPPPHGFPIFPNWNWNIFEKKRWENVLYTIKSRKEDARLIPSIFWSYIQAKLGPLHGRTPSPHHL